jgi:predicted ATP-grasp superfamily ATP-dependent carboligase
VYPTREETVAALARHRDELTESYRIPTPRWDVTKWAWDKRNTYRRAAELGIPAPRTWYASQLDDVGAIDGEPPFAIKPAIKEHFIYATKCKAWRADSRAELDTRFREAAALVGTGEVIVQELIPGSGRRQLAYCAFFRDGRAQASMTVRRLRQHPPEFGRASTYVETVDLPELEELSERFLRAIDNYGLVELEYKQDERDGRYKLLDVNARTWGYHTVAQCAGVDFPYLLYADQLGLPAPDAARTRPGVFWIRLATDVPTALVELVGGRMDWRGYLRSLRVSNVESVFTRDDPRPGMAELALLPYLSVKRGF